jgi:hypothetical protein
MGHIDKIKIFLKSNSYLIALLILGSFTWSLTMIKSGFIYSYGMGFWGPNGHDGIWHIAIIESLVKGSWDIPIFAGETLKNYHVGFDLLTALVHKLTLVPVVNLYFQIIPPILAFLIGVFVYKFVYYWRRSKLQAFWSTFFVYFGGSFGWIVTLIRRGELGGESLFWSQQSISTLVNPPFALSILLMFIGLYLLVVGLRKKSKRLLALTTLIFGILIQVKVYAGILALGGLFIAGVWRMFQRRGIGLIKIFTGSLIVSVLLFLPLNRGAEQTVVLKPFWFLETMMALSDRLDWPRYGEAMVNYKLAGNFIKGIPAYLIALALFWFGNLGTRIVKEPQFINHLKNFRKLSYMEVFFYSVIWAGLTIPTFFLQVGTPWNTIQFMYYSLMFSGILAGIALGSYLERSKNEITTLLVVLLTIPTTIGTLRHYLPSRPPAKISNQELEALKFLSNQPDGVVLTYPFDRGAAMEAESNPPRPLNLYESTAYVSAFAKKDVYLEDEVNLDITGYDWRGRRFKVEKFLASQDQGKVQNFLKENQIKYIYWLKRQRAVLGETQLGIEKIFENSGVDIYKVVI